jgi:3-hydroxyisobutyrate dehydrogenase-like beta-hydroxyacid dehydrogenase
MKRIEKIAFLGLGVMGGPMAGHLCAKTDCAVTVYNRTSEKAAKWLVENPKGRVAGTVKDAVSGADLVLLCVGNDDDLRAIITAPGGVLEGLRGGEIVVDHTTVSANVSREVSALLNERGVHFIDAPVSGGQAGAVNGTLTVMAGGSKDAFAVVAPLLKSAYAREMRLMGGVGAGQITKMVNQICIAGAVQGLSEALAFGMKNNLEMDEVLAVIGKGAAQSWQMDNRGKTMVRDEFDFGFALDWMIKDLQIVVEQGRDVGADLTVTQQILDFYRELSAQGHGHKDTSALIKRLVN